MKGLLGALACALLAAAATPAWADLVVNGGFETGDFTGWTWGGNTGFTGVATGYYAHSGTYGAVLGPVGSDGELSQFLATIAGDSYTITFYLKSDGGTPNDFTADFGSTTMLSESDVGATDWIKYSYTETATSSSTLLAFFLRDDPGFWALDDISVNSASAVPEPASLALLGTGLVAAAGAARRRKRAKKA